MIQHQMPPDTREREKIIGGLLDLGQLLWLLLGAGLYGIFLFTFFSMLGGFSFVIGLPILASGVPFAFKKINNLTLFQYLRLKRRYKRKIKGFVNFGGVSFPTDDELKNGRG